MTAHDPDGRVTALLVRFVLLALVIGGTGALVGTMFLPTAVAVASMVSTAEQDVFDVPPLPEGEPLVQNSFVYAADGSEIAELNYQENRVLVTLDQVPEVAKNAVIATEDATFWEHNGVNHRAIVRAAVANARAGDITQGGSTITQQYVKNAYLTTDQTLNRKIKEAMYAVELEKRHTKEEILERYLNHTYFGSGVYGIGTAAERYFSKAVEDLTLAEAAVLAGVIRSPEGNSPLRDPENALRRRNVVLDQMAINGYVTAEQAEAAKALDLGLAPKEPAPPANPFWVDWVTRLLINEPAADALGSQLDALATMGETQEERVAAVFQGGLRIHTTLDPEFQAMAEESLVEHLTYEGESPEEIAQEPFGGLVSVEPGTGAIRTLAVGPREFGACDEPIGLDAEGRQLCDKTKFNPLVPADEGSARVGRQPGSSFKPFVVAAALEQGIPPGWQVDATGPATIPGCDNGADWEVNNSGGDGLRDMYSGVQASSNVFHAMLIEETGPANVVDMATRLGIRRSPLPAECALALGAVEVFPLEMAAAYATLANGGEYCAPFAITRIEDREGNLLYEHSTDCEQVIDSSVADRVVDIMAGPVSAGGTAPIANLGRWPTRGKTGTTNDYRDAWFVGYVKQLATAAWIGYENGVVTYDCEANPDKCAAEDSDCFDVSPEGTTRRCVETRLLRNVTIAGTSYKRVFGGTIPAPMWKTYMERAVERFEPASFPRPGPLPAATVPDLLAAGSIDEAEELAEAAKLHVVPQTVDHYEPAGTFVAQDPAPGSRVPAGRAIVLQVSNGTAERPVIPSVVGLRRAAAEQVLTDAGYAYEVVLVDTTAAVDDGVVVNQSPNGGTAVEGDDPVVVVIEVGRLVEGGGDDGDPGDEPSDPAEDPVEPEPSPTTTEPPPDDGGGNNGNGNGNGNGGGG
ncbi:MAG: transglycosylase domain-containing protein [Actinobacteria bacterium]|nr:transglycosylase domain-containing protein [Actinomycetota bacterium]